MKKALLFIGIFLGALVLLWVTGRLTNAFQTFKIQSKADEPSLSLGKTIIASKLKKPQLFNFICYQTEDEQLGNYIAVHRICGMPGDTVEIRNGDLFINGKSVDQTLNLRHPYRMHLNDYKEELNQSGRESLWEKDSVVVFLDDRQVLEKRLKAIRKIKPSGEPDEYISKKFSAPWNQDHFGPVKVPVHHYFVLGDNRLESNDSRYSGFVPSSKIVATVLWQ